MSVPSFTSWLAPFFRRHVDLKQASGYDYRSTAILLARFDRYLLDRRVASPLRASDLTDYLAILSHLSPITRANHASAIWPALSYARRHGARVGALPERPRLPPAALQQRAFVLSPSQVKCVLAAIPRLAPQRPAFSRATDACLLGLLYTTGIRIAEALALDVADFNLDRKTLLVRRGKFGKSRLLPLHATTAAALQRYIDDQCRPLTRAPEAPVFVSCRRRRLEYSAARSALRRVARLAQVRDEKGRLPRLHDLRHTFAVHRLAAWYRAGKDVNSLLPLLSTYMGHVDPKYTYHYLRFAELLFGEAVRRFELWADTALEGGLA